MNRSVDSLSAINKDYSGSYFVQLSHLTLDEMVKIRDFVNQECMKFWSIPQDPEGNMIGFSAWKFYSSPELDHFIRQTIQQKYKIKLSMSFPYSTNGSTNTTI